MGVVQSKRRKHLKGDTTHGATIHNSGQAHSSAYHPTSHQSTATEGSGYSHQLRDSSSSNTGSYGIGGLKGSRTSHSSPSTPNYSSLTSPSVQKPFQPKPTTELQFTGLHSNSLFLPVDWDAQDSQLEQHFALKSLFGGLILPAIAAELAHVPFAKVVDIGCGSGTWMMDMATHYSDWEFIGIPVTGLLGNSYDTSVAPDTLLPPNVRIEYPMGEPHKAPLQDNSVDLVNISAQGLLFGNSHWQCALKEIYRILKPGGLLQVVDLHNAPVGTVLIESFIDTVRNILKGLDKDYDDALHLSTLLPASGFQVIQTMNKQVNFGSDSSLGQEFIGITLRMFASVQSILGPRMGLEADDYQQRVEMVCAQCVQYNAHMNWLGYVARKSID